MEPVLTAVLFVDVCGSTAYFDQRGEVAGQAMLERCFRLVVPEIELRKGRVVKRIGDGLLAVFDRAPAMLRAISAAHVNVAEANEGQAPEERIRIHSGCHFGPVVFDESGDVFGDVVNVAARVQGMAGPDEVFVTADVLREIGPDDPPVDSRQIGTFPLRGKESDVELHEVIWRSEHATMLFSRSALAELGATLHLRFDGETVELRTDRRRLSIGRIDGNDVVVPDSAVSREHAEIVRRRNFYYLVDRSTNGTYLRPSNGKPRHVHREEILLEGKGSFALGRPDGPPVEYEVGT
ncbi:MAG: FHA domain-containing protein [Candidatus Binatia bacterium]